ncbi:MAG: 4a-hydroxytetrahydrobiopterin dehydratase [Verrucomicrobiales bacterium]|jgi:4a-hydroxytetrahydrobiopterin dehydratase|nr:4a-hydroxytetrahydrobiopterin dehydratase [Verrucomicrobiales bacterium]
MSELIDPDELEGLLKKLPEWDLENNSIVRMMEFDDFMEAIDFVNAVAEIAEEAGHHPDIDIRWCTITVRLTTHDVGGLTEADLDVAKKIDTLVD